MDAETLHVLGFKVTTWVVNIVGFLILLAMLKAWLWGPLSRTIEGRAERIANQLREAEEKLAEADRVRREADEYYAARRTEADELREKVMREAQREADALRQAAREEANNIRRQGREDALELKVEALEEAKAQLANLAAAMAERLLREVLDEEGQKALADAAIRDLQELARREELN